jgi:hypothetical protein
MLFDEYQTTQQVWRYIAPVNTYVSGSWNASDYEITDNFISKQDIFNEASINIEVGLTLSSGATIGLYLETSHDTFVLGKTFTAVSGLNTLSCTISGTTYYKGISVTHVSGITEEISWLYVGDKTYATKDDEFVDGIWKRMLDITGRIEPFLSMGFQSLKNDQTFSNITETDYVPYEYKSYVQPSDGIVDVNGIQYKVVGPAEVYPSILESIVLHLERSQWNVT